ncbi:MAG: class I adenylate-forming enzyme family protein [Syntrophorhabdaceae bacterium]|nr:class I adenylate-forming enzyme family protein [Syntrophorhabdaceae bacterium]MDD5243564.1 class I adenylate-forming enzyme family protein [Syntrophorhabdaceae bacterium]
MTTNECVYDLFLKTVDTYKNKIALVYLGEKYSFTKLKRLAERVGTGFYDLGVRPGDRVMLYIPNSPQWILAWLGLQYVGAIAVPVSPIYTAHDMGYIARDSGARVILCSDTNFGYVKRVKAEGVPLDTVIVTNIADMLPWWKRYIGFAFDKIPDGKVEASDVYTWDRLLKTEANPSCMAASRPDEIMQILYTGGTTKFPKGVPFKHTVFVEGLMAQLKVSEPLIPLDQNRIVQGAPLFHIQGEIFSLGPICLTGSTVILMPRVNLDAIFLYVKRYRATTLFGVPALYRMFLEHDRIDYYDLSSLKYCFTGGDVIPLEVMRRWKQKFGVPISQGYGTTETVGGVTMVPVLGDWPEDSIGPVLSIKKVKIVNPDTLEEVAVGQPGEILVHSDPMIDRYWNKEEETRECFVDIDGLLWYRTGDIVRADDKGYLYFVDRTADIIKHKGYRVSASEIEAVLKDHSAVIAAIAVGVPDRRVGERIKAFVVLKEDAEGVTGYDLIRWCKDRLTSYKVPEYIEFRDMLPKSKVGKYLRRELRQQERKS